MDLNEIQQYFDTNKDNEDVKTFLGKLSTPTVDGVKGFLEQNEDGKKYLQSLTDAKVTKGIESWRTNNLQKIVDDAVKAANPSETPEQKAMRELQDKIANMEKEKTYESLKNKALTVATEKKIPMSLVDMFIGNDEDTTVGNLGKFEEAMKPYIQASVEERLKSGSYTPPGGGGGGNGELSLSDAIKGHYTK